MQGKGHFCETGPTTFNLFFFIMLSGCLHLNSLEPSSSSSLKNLRHLDLSDCGVTDAGLERAARAAPHLNNVYLRKCPAVTGK